MMHGTLAHLLSTYGYVILFLLIGIESFGVPLPGETARRDHRAARTIQPETD